MLGGSHARTLEALRQANDALTDFVRDMDRRYGTSSRVHYLMRDQLRFDELRRAYNEAFNRVVNERREGRHHHLDDHDRGEPRAEIDERQMVRLLRFRNRPFDEQLQSVRTFLQFVDNDGDGVIDAEELIGHCPLLSSFVAIQQGYHDDFRITIDELASMIVGILRDNDLAAVELLDCPTFARAEADTDAAPVHAPAHHLDAFLSASRDQRKQVVLAYLHAVDDDDNDHITDEELRSHCPSMADMLLAAFPEDFTAGVEKDVVANQIVEFIAQEPTHYSVAELLNSQTFEFAFSQCETFVPRARPVGDDADHLHSFLAIPPDEQKRVMSAMLACIADEGVVDSEQLSESCPELASELLAIDEMFMYGIPPADLAERIVGFGLHENPLVVDELLRSPIFRMVWEPPEDAPTALHAPPEQPFGDDFDFEGSLNGLAQEMAHLRDANRALSGRVEGMRRAQHQNILQKQEKHVEIGHLEAEVASSTQSCETQVALLADIDQALNAEEPFESDRRAIVEKRARIRAQLERLRSAYEVVDAFTDAERGRNERRAEWDRLSEAEQVQRVRMHRLEPATTPDPRLEFAPIPKPHVVQVLEDLDAQLKAQLEAIDRYACSDAYAYHSDEDPVGQIEEADAVIFDDGRVECKYCFGYSGVLRALKAYVETDGETRTIGTLDHDMNFHLRTLKYRTSAVIPAADLHLLVPDAVRRLLLRGKTFVACKQMDRMRRVKDLSRQIIDITEQEAGVVAQLHDLEIEWEAGRRRLDELTAREEHMNRARDAAVARAAQQARDAAARAAAEERARVAARQAEEQRARRAEEQARELRERVARDRAQAGRDEELGRRLALNANLEQQCPTCNLPWIWHADCATIDCEGCKATRRPRYYCYYCKAGPWEVEGTDAHEHIKHCRFNPLQDRIFPGDKKKEAVVRAHVRNAVAYLQGLARNHSASVIGHAIRCMRGRFLDDHFVSHENFFEFYGINPTDELRNQRDFTRWFDEECRQCNIPVPRHGGSQGGGRVWKGRPTRETTPRRIRTHPAMGHAPPGVSTRPTPRGLSPRGISPRGSARGVRRTAAAAHASRR